MPTSSHADQAVRILRLSGDLLNTYLSWCPASDRPLVAPGSTAPPVRGRLDLQVQQLAGLGPLRDLIGRKGWLRMDAFWIEEDPKEQFLLCAVIVEVFDRPAMRVAPLNLWHAWQPSYSPVFHRDLTGQTLPSSTMHAALEQAIKDHRDASVTPWIQRHMEDERTRLMKSIDALTAQVDQLDEQRRAMQKAHHVSGSARATLRAQLCEAELGLAHASEMLAGVKPRVPRVARKVLCEIAWSLTGPSVRAWRG